MEQLAIFGGTPAVPAGSIQSWPPFTQEDRDMVMSVFDSNILHGFNAPHHEALMKEFAEYIGAKYCLVTNSGTSALHMALGILGLGCGDEVIVPAFTYWSSAAAVLHQNCIPVFVDIEPDTYCMDPAKIEAAITPRTKAILPVHIHGMAADLDRICAIAKKHNLYVVGDCCQAHGASVNGRKVGSIEDTAGFSTNRSKCLSSGEGGLVTTNSDELYQVARWWRAFDELPVPGDSTRHITAFGYNYRPHEFVNALIRSQLKRLPENNARRYEMAHYLTDALQNIPGLKGPIERDGRKPVYFSYVVEFKPEELGLDVPVDVFKKAMVEIFKAEGIGFGQWQTQPVPAMKVFQEKLGYNHGCPWNCKHYNYDIKYNGDDFPVTQQFIAAHSYLGGIYPPNGTELLDKYIEGFKKVTSQPEKILEYIHR